MRKRGVLWCDGVFVPPSALRERRPDGQRARGKGKAASSAQTDGTNQVSQWGMRFFLLPWSLPLFTVSYSILLLLSCVLHFHLSQLLCLLCHIYVPPHLPVLISFLPCPQDPLLSLSLCISLSLPHSLSLSLSPLCLVLDMLPKTTSTPCFTLLTLECKRQRE